MARVLVIDDERDSTDIFAILLQRDGHDVEALNQPERAVEVALQHQPDLVLCEGEYLDTAGRGGACAGGSRSRAPHESVSVNPVNYFS